MMGRDLVSKKKDTKVSLSMSWHSFMQFHKLLKRVKPRCFVRHETKVVLFGFPSYYFVNLDRKVGGRNGRRQKMKME